MRNLLSRLSVRRLSIAPGRSVGRWQELADGSRAAWPNRDEGDGSTPIWIQDKLAPARAIRGHLSGAIKTWLGHTRFLTRRLKNVSTEMALNILSHSVKRLIALTGVRHLMQAIPA
jgi:hypothetical protein